MPCAKSEGCLRRSRRCASGGKLPAGSQSENEGLKQEKKGKHVHTEYFSDEIGSFLGVFEKGSLEELRGSWSGQRVVST